MGVEARPAFAMFSKSRFSTSASRSFSLSSISRSSPISYMPPAIAERAIEVCAVGSECEECSPACSTRLVSVTLKASGSADEEVAVHVEPGRDAGAASSSLKTVPRVGGDAAGVHDSDRIEHGAAVFVEDHIVSDGIANQLQADPLGFEGSCIRTVVIAFDRRRIHEVHLDETDPPLPDQRPIRLAQIFLRPRMRRIQRIERVHVCRHKSSRGIGWPLALWTNQSL